MLRALTLSSALFAHGAHALPRPSWAVGPANTPPMGFNTVRFPDPTPLPSCWPLTAARARQWNLYHCSVTADILTETAAAMVKTGLKDAGYIYVNRRAPSRPSSPSLHWLEH